MNDSLARPIGFGLLLASPGLLILGNHLLPEVPGRDVTPFDLGGPSFLLLLPLFAVLAWRGHWGAALGAVVLHHSALVALTVAWVGLTAALAIIAVDAAVIAAIVFADRDEPTEPGAPPGTGEAPPPS